MKIKELKQKYGEELIERIIENNYLDGCTIAINQDGSEDIPEIDIKNALKHMQGISFEWD